MLKHRGFPSRMTGTDFHFTIRRANLKEGATKLIRRERFRDRKKLDRAADSAFLAALWEYFGEDPFERGNLDAGRLSWLFGREVRGCRRPVRPVLLRRALENRSLPRPGRLPRSFRPRGAPPGFDDWDDQGEAE